MSIPPGYTVQTGKEKGSRSYIPICHNDSLVCIEFQSGHYKGTNFEDAAVEVTLLPAKTEQACLNPGKYEVSTFPDAEFQIDAKSPSRVIDGARFLHSFFGGGAMSNDIARDSYRGFKDGNCYELAVEVAFANFGVYPPGAIKEFTKQDKRQVRAELLRIIDSFRSLRGAQ